MIINFYQEDTKYRISNKKVLSNWIYEIVSLNKKELNSLNIIFTSSRKLKKINNQFLSHNYFTDVITFNYSCGDTLEGEIYIDYHTVRENAKVYGEAFKKELCRVIIHGVFHLIGFSDNSHKEFTIMKKLEDEALELLAINYGFKF